MRAVQRLQAEADQEVVCHKIDVLAHLVRVHAQQGDVKSLPHEEVLNLHRLRHDLAHNLRRGWAQQLGVEEHRKLPAFSREEALSRRNISIQ